MTRAVPETAARPTRKARRTRERLLDASLALFQEKGFRESSMREIAARAGLSPGATYYHFRSKEELVFALYARTQDDAEADAEGVLARTRRFDERIGDLLFLRLDHLLAYRGFFSVLAARALDLHDPVSPFSVESKPTRDRAIEIMRRAVDDSDLRCHDALRRRLPLLLWLLQMAVIYLWIHDASPGQTRTRRITQIGAGLLVRALSLSALPLPGVGTLVKGVGRLVDEIEAITDPHDPSPAPGTSPPR